MNYSRRQLYALGEPLGNSATYRKADGGLVLGGGGGGGGSAPPPDKTTQTAELPEWARPYAKDTLAKGAALTDINQNPYQRYNANRIAGFSPMQQQAFQGAANMQPSQQLGTGTDLATAAGLGALNTQYQAGQFDNQFQAPGQYQPGQFSMMQAQAPDLQNFQMGPAERVRTQSFNRPGSAEAYMSPYMQNVVDIQQREAQRQADIAGTGRNAQAVKSGAFGGSRQAIMDAEAARNLATQKGDIQATGQQAAFQNAQQQFNAEQQARLQAQQANQQAGLTVGGQNLNALLGVQQLGAGQNLQSQLANQQAYQQAQNAAEQSRQFGAGQGLQAAGLGAQYGQAAQQLGEQSRQYGAGLGMQGLQTGLQAAGQLGQLGGQQFQQGMDINKLQSAYGGQMQQQAQRPLDQAYQDFLNQQNYPYKQLGFMSDMIRGLPLGQQSTSSIYSQGPGTVQTLAGLGGAAYGFGKSGLFGKEGGLMKSYAGGGVTSQQNVESILPKLSDQQLQKAKETALSRRDVEQANMIDAEMAERASVRGGLGNAFNQIPQEQQEEMMAGGGIVAFAPGGVTYKNQYEKSLTSLKDMADQQPAVQTPEQRDEAISARMPMLEKRYGPDVTVPYLEETKSKRAGLADQMEKDKGLAFAMASLGLLSRKKTPGESQKQQLLSGLGEAGQMFAGEVSKLKKENIAADDKLRQSEILLATAQQSRKEGLINKADAEENRADDKRQDAFKTKIGIQEKVAQLQSGLAGTEMQGENALKVAGVTAASHLAAAKIAAAHPTDLDKQADAIYAAKVAKDPSIASDPQRSAQTRADARESAASQIGRYPGESKAANAANALYDKKYKESEAAVDNILTMNRALASQYRMLQAEDKKNGTNTASDFRDGLIQQHLQRSAPPAQAAQGQATSQPVPGGTGTPSRSGPQPTSTTVPTMQAFMDAARKANPGVSDADLAAYYNQKYAK
jgi:hypothetical protein